MKRLILSFGMMLAALSFSQDALAGSTVYYGRYLCQQCSVALGADALPDIYLFLRGTQIVPLFMVPRGGPGNLNTGKGGRTAPRNRAGSDPRGAGNDEEAYAAHA